MTLPEPKVKAQFLATLRELTARIENDQPVAMVLGWMNPVERPDGGYLHGAVFGTREVTHSILDALEEKLMPGSGTMIEQLMSKMAGAPPHPQGDEPPCIQLGMHNEADKASGNRVMLIPHDAPAREVLTHTKPTMQELYTWLKCDMIQVIKLEQGWQMIVDEEAAFRGASINPAATHLAKEHSKPPVNVPDGGIKGNVVLVHGWKYG